MNRKSVKKNPPLGPVIAQWEAAERNELREALSNFASDYQAKETVYVQANAKSAKSILDLCDVAAGAWRKFVQLPDYLDEFRQKTNLTNKSTFSQHRTIGMNYQRLSAHADQLPSSWYALYQIARLKEDVFEQAVAAKKIHSRVTQRELDVLAGRNKNKPTRKFIQIEFPSTTPLVAADLLTFQDSFRTFLLTQPAPFNANVKIEWSKPLTDAVRVRKPSRRGSRRKPVPPFIASPSPLPQSTVEVASDDPDIAAFFACLEEAA